MIRTLLLAMGLFFLLPLTAWAHGAEGVVTEQHHEELQVGPYRLHIGFSEWPLRADRSLDFIFYPADGIVGKTGTLTLIGPDGFAESEPLGRFPRARSVWGLDVRSLPLEGVWQVKFVIDGPLGRGEGMLPYLRVGPRPGPPIALSWLIGFLPILTLLALIILAWRRVKPMRLAESYTWF